MLDNYGYSFDQDTIYCYPDSETLKNKLSIQNSEALFIAEREITSLRIADAKITAIKGNLDFNHLKAIHKYIFSDIYAWAGKPRILNISKGNLFCRCEYIETNANDIFSKLEKENYLLDTPKSDIPLKLAYYLGEINALHPFREGNGRSQRLFIEYLAGIAGLNVSFADISATDMIEASALSFASDYSKLNEMFIRITSPISKEEQLENILLITNKTSKIFKAFNK